jgi:hypothetical protein
MPTAVAMCGTGDGEIPFPQNYFEILVMVPIKHWDIDWNASSDL